MKRRITKGENCLNCGRELQDENFCPDCGQLNNTAKPTFGQLVMDALANLFAFDSKFYKSIWPLMRYPGRLSLEVVKGRKSTYLPPIRLFLLVGIITLGTNSLFQRIERGFADASRLQQARNDTTRIGVRTDAEGSTDLNSNKDLTITFGDDGDTLAVMYNYAASHPDQLPDSALTELKLKHTFWNRFLYTNMLKLTLMTPSDLGNYLKNNLLIIVLLFAPIMALLLKGLYFYKRDYFYVDHFVFALHVITAFFVIFFFVLLLNTIFSTSIFNRFILAYLVYFYLALKKFYNQKWYYTLGNYTILSGAFFGVSIIFLLLVALISFLLI